jgi:hypothetical protein
MTERYKITCTYDFAPDEPNIFVWDREASIDYLIRVVPGWSVEQLEDGGTVRLAPAPDGLVLRWEQAPPEVNEGTGTGTGYRGADAETPEPERKGDRA